MENILDKVAKGSETAKELIQKLSYYTSDEEIIYQTVNKRFSPFGKDEFLRILASIQGSYDLDSIKDKK